TPHGRRVGLISDDAWAGFLTKQERQEKMKQLLERTKVTSAMLTVIPPPGERPEAAGHSLDESGPLGRDASAGVSQPDFRHTGVRNGQGATISSGQSFGDLSSALGQPLAQLLKRPEMNIERLAPVLRELAPDFFTPQNSTDDRSPSASEGF